MVLFDKTGVLTYGASQFVRELLFGDSEDPEDRESAEALLASVERESGHPFAHAFAGCLEDLPPLEVEAMDAIWGQGIASQVVGHEVLAGNRLLVERLGIVLADEVKKDLDALETEEGPLVLAAVDGRLVLALGIRGEVSEGMGQDLEASRKLGVLSGDSQKTAERVGRELGLDEVRAGRPPS
ncbi:HAD family hydrolase [Atopobium sp. oral taxon 416]|uniref:HAD family hydrolase n=1 Tax=Atopobium sp. oral taxon 416 TaxID=712157 RepID=UPI0035300724